MGELQADETGQSVSEWIGSLIEKDRGGIEVMARHPPKVRVDPSAEMPTAPAATEEAKPRVRRTISGVRVQPVRGATNRVFSGEGVPKAC